MNDAVGAIDALEAALARLNFLATLAEMEARRELIVIRRNLPGLINSVSASVDRAIEGSRLPDRAQRQVMFRHELSTLRSAIALHQGNWSASSIDADLPGYLESAHRVQRHNGAFLRLTRTLLRDLA